jgi:hypothetical protein
MESAADRAVSQSVTNALTTAGVPAHTIQNIHVRSLNGRVTLTGHVSTQAEKDQIENQVKETPGVRTVIDQLRVGAGQGAESSGTSGLENSPSSSSSSTSGNTGTGTSPSTTTPQR